jgi:TusA-related sulfurtransferase
MKKYGSLIIVLIVLIFCVFQVTGAFATSRDTGVLNVLSTDAGATITIGKTGYESTNVGTGSAHIRLTPGTYQVIASDNKNQATKMVTIHSKQTTNQNITPVSASNTTSSGLLLTLPHEGPSDEYVIAANASSVITVTASSPQARQDALQWIRTQGYDPSNFNIQFNTQ